MVATITYTLSQAGQRASILAGGNGQAQQTLTVDPTSQEFARLVAAGDVSRDGNITLSLNWRHKSFDAPATAAEVLDYLDALKIQEKNEEAARKAAKLAETRLVLTERRTTSHSETIGVDRAGAQVNYGGVCKSAYRWDTANWPYEADSTVTGSPEAQAWEAELSSARQTALETALELARAQLPALLEQERVAAEKAAQAKAERDAQKVALGGEESDLLLRVESGALAQVPSGCWENHKRGKNWMATISVSPSSPGGLARDFLPKAHGEYYYQLGQLNPGTPIEIGADYYSGGGRKRPMRWYGYVIAQTEEYLLLRESSSGKSACKEGAKWAKTHAPLPATDSIEQGISRVNGEGAIVQS
jgi:hypothetical protein